MDVKISTAESIAGCAHGGGVRPGGPLPKRASKRTGERGEGCGCWVGPSGGVPGEGERGESGLAGLA